MSTAALTATNGFGNSGVILLVLDMLRQLNSDNIFAVAGHFILLVALLLGGQVIALQWATRDEDWQHKQWD